MSYFPGFVSCRLEFGRDLFEGFVGLFPGKNLLRSQGLCSISPGSYSPQPSWQVWRLVRWQTSNNPMTPENRSPGLEEDKVDKAEISGVRACCHRAHCDAAG